MKVVAKNKEIAHQYEVLETYEAGVVLTGAEVKSVKQGAVNLKGSFASIKPDNIAWLLGVHIARYKPAGIQKDYEPTRPRKLLLTTRELDQLRGRLAQKGLTLAPLKVYTVRGLIKVEIGLLRGLKKHDKRNRLKQRAIDLDLKRELKNKY